MPAGTASLLPWLARCGKNAKVTFSLTSTVDLIAINGEQQRSLLCGLTLCADSSCRAAKMRVNDRFINCNCMARGDEKKREKQEFEAPQQEERALRF